MLMLVTSPEVLVVIEDGCTDCLLGSVLPNDIVIDSLLQVSRVEMRDAKCGLVEHWASPRIDRGVIRVCEARVEVCSPPRSQDGTAC